MNYCADVCFQIEVCTDELKAKEALVWFYERSGCFFSRTCCSLILISCLQQVLIFLVISCFSRSYDNPKVFTEHTYLIPPSPALDLMSSPLHSKFNIWIINIIWLTRSLIHLEPNGNRKLFKILWRLKRPEVFIWIHFQTFLGYFRLSRERSA